MQVYDTLQEMAKRKTKHMKFYNECRFFAISVDF